ncbi:hypothetical protein ACOSQ2_001685 [Xanthoceras sorbifolium]
MSISTPTCNFSAPPIHAGGDMLHFQPEYQIENREHQTLPHDDYPSFKKQRFGEALVLNPRMPVTSNNVLSGNLVNKPLDGTWKGDDRVISEMQLCRMFYYTRICMYEDRCRFSHVNPVKVNQDLVRFRDGTVISTGTSGCSRDHRSGFGQFASKEFGDGVNPRSVMWKTKLCRNWERTGGCLYGKTCYFAHGQTELRKLGRHNALESRIVQMNVSNTYSTGNDQSRTTCKQQVQDMNCALKWKKLEKISGIYADWIEDTPLLQSRELS